MTITPDSIPTAESDIEHQLTERLRLLAAGFVADLEQQGRLVGPGDAGVLERLRAQVETRRDLPAAYRATVETITGECGYPSEVAVRVATALHRNGLIRADAAPVPIEAERVETAAEREPVKEEAPAEVPAPPVRVLRGAVVVPVRHAARAEAVEPAPTPPMGIEQVTGRVPSPRPAAARLSADAEPSPGAQPVPPRTSMVCRQLRDTSRDRLELRSLNWDSEHVAIVIRAACLDDWEHWLSVIGGAGAVATRTVRDTQVATGHVDGVQARLTAYEVPRLLQEAQAAATAPHYLWGRIYDLGRGQIDRTGRVWVHLGQYQDNSGMPMLVARGSEGPLYPLNAIVMTYGPLRPIALPSNTPAQAATGGQA
jgi:hypothetical protein